MPDPALLGRPIVTFGIVHPFAERYQAAKNVWEATREAVIVWAFRDALFGVFFLLDMKEASLLHAKLGDSVTNRSVLFLDCDSRSGAIPVYFDFEAAWSQITGLSGTLGYPHSLPSSTLTAGKSSVEFPKEDHDALCRLLSRPFGGENGSTSTRWLDRFGQSSREERLLTDGAGQFRSFLSPSACANWATGFPEAVAFIQGTLVEGRSSPELFRALVERGGASPFLFATNGSSVLFGSLSKSADVGAPKPSLDRAPLLPIIRTFLQQIIVIREPLGGSHVLVNHRYDRPFRTQV